MDETGYATSDRRSKTLGIESTVMLTGDDLSIAESVASQAGIDVVCQPSA